MTLASTCRHADIRRLEVYCAEQRSVRQRYATNSMATLSNLLGLMQISRADVRTLSIVNCILQQCSTTTPGLLGNQLHNAVRCRLRVRLWADSQKGTPCRMP